VTENYLCLSPHFLVAINECWGKGSTGCLHQPLCSCASGWLEIGLVSARMDFLALTGQGMRSQRRADIAVTSKFADRLGSVSSFTSCSLKCGRGKLSRARLPALEIKRDMFSGLSAYFRDMCQCFYVRISKGRFPN
jgi:hypothetical protein